jgi:hypothetical protein
MYICDHPAFLPGFRCGELLGLSYNPDPGRLASTPGGPISFMGESFPLCGNYDT